MDTSGGVGTLIDVQKHLPDVHPLWKRADIYHTYCQLFLSLALMVKLYWIKWQGRYREFFQP